MNLHPLTQLWVYLGTSPLLWLALTISAYALAVRLQQALGGNALLSPVLLSVATIVAVLVISKTPYPHYFEGAQFVHFLLGTATVALAVPLRQTRALRPNVQVLHADSAYISVKKKPAEAGFQERSNGSISGCSLRCADAAA